MIRECVRSYGTVKLSMLTGSACALLFGFVWHDAGFVIGGAAIHLLLGIADLFFYYRAAKLLRAGTQEFPPQQPRVAGWINGAITLTGLVLLIVGSGGYAMGGWIIWLGAIVCWLSAGIILREVGGMPLSMGYGGWAIRRTRNGRY